MIHLRNGSVGGHAGAGQSQQTRNRATIRDIGTAVHKIHPMQYSSPAAGQLGQLCRLG